MSKHQFDHSIRFTVFQCTVHLFERLMFFSLMTVEYFQLRYAHNPLSLYQTVQQCLNSEMHLVQVTVK